MPRHRQLYAWLRLPILDTELLQNLVSRRQAGLDIGLEPRPPETPRHVVIDSW